MKKNSKGQQKKRVICIVFLIVLVSMLCIIIMHIKKSFSIDGNSCQENVARLERLEKSDISALENKLKELKQSSANATQIQESIADGMNTVLSDIEIRQKFQGTVIIGDSITESIVEYGFLDTDVVISKRGLSIVDADEQLNTAISLYPSTIFLSFGANDLELYDGNVEPFKEAYLTQVAKLKEALPNTPIYIHCILPLQDIAIERNAALSKYPEFNAALQEICTELECTFIDHSFLLENNPSMYEPDGEHVVMEFYPLWLTYIAEMAGL